MPDYKLAIEFDGVYYHGENASNKRCNNNYHLYKTNLCKEKGIQLIHIFEDEWLYRKSIIKSLLKEKLNLSIEIDFCKCSVRSISVDTICEFIEKNSLCTVKNSSHNFGIFLLEELVGVFCVNYNNDLVYCNKIDYIINGLLDNIVSHLPKFSHYTVSLDRRYYPLPNLAYNWVFIKETFPKYFYTKARVRYDINNFSKDKLKDIAPEYYDDSLTEWEIMQKIGYDRIWDCGDLIYEYNLR